VFGWRGTLFGFTLFPTRKSFFQLVSEICDVSTRLFELPFRSSNLFLEFFNLLLLCLDFLVSVTKLYVLGFNIVSHLFVGLLQFIQLDLKLLFVLMV